MSDDVHAVTVVLDTGEALYAASGDRDAMDEECRWLIEELERRPEGFIALNASRGVPRPAEECSVIVVNRSRIIMVYGHIPGGAKG